MSTPDPTRLTPEETLEELIKRMNCYQDQCEDFAREAGATNRSLALTRDKALNLDSLRAAVELSRRMEGMPEKARIGRGQFDLSKDWSYWADYHAWPVNGPSPLEALRAARIGNPPPASEAGKVEHG